MASGVTLVAPTRGRDRADRAWQTGLLVPRNRRLCDAVEADDDPARAAHADAALEASRPFAGR
jgi:hypothetical protein